jgi:hypothetical protein
LQWTNQTFLRGWGRLGRNRMKIFLIFSVKLFGLTCEPHMAYRIQLNQIDNPPHVARATKHTHNHIFPSFSARRVLLGQKYALFWSLPPRGRATKRAPSLSPCLLRLAMTMMMTTWTQCSMDLPSVRNAERHPICAAS